MTTVFQNSRWRISWINLDAWNVTVIALCHSDPHVMGRLIVTAQDRGMMEGDFAWFVFTDFISQALLEPWTASSVYNGSDSQYRLTALYSVNLVTMLLWKLCNTLNID